MKWRRVVPLATSGHGSRLADLLHWALVSVTWAAAVAAGLWLLRSELPGDLRRRKGAVYPAVAQGESKEILGGGETGVIQGQIPPCRERRDKGEAPSLWSFLRYTFPRTRTFEKT